MISKERLEEFKKIYKKKFGKDISDQDALEQATKLMRLMEIIYKPMTQEQYDQLQKRRKETADC
jgi:hypothetical protein